MDNMDVGAKLVNKFVFMTPEVNSTIEIFSITDGRLTLGEGFTYDDAAKAFVDALERLGAEVKVGPARVASEGNTVQDAMAAIEKARDAYCFVQSMSPAEVVDGLISRLDMYKKNAQEMEQYMARLKKERTMTSENT